MSIDDLLEQLETCTLLQALDRLYELRYDGPMTFHFQNGTARKIEVSEPLRRAQQDLCLTAREEMTQTAE